MCACVCEREREKPRVSVHACLCACVCLCACFNGSFIFHFSLPQYFVCIKIIIIIIIITILLDLSCKNILGKDVSFSTPSLILQKFNPDYFLERSPFLFQMQIIHLQAKFIQFTVCVSSSEAHTHIHIYTKITTQPSGLSSVFNGGTF